MRKLAVLVVFVLSGCAYPTVSVKKDLSATARFSHRAHKKFIEENGCIPCHKMNVEMSIQEIEEAERGLKKIVMPSKVTCHYCHNNPEENPVPSAPTDCRICHYNLKEIMPKDHTTGDWMRIHKSVYSVNSKKCYECHRERFCVDCHQRRDPISFRFHPRNYEYIHSFEAVSNPARCGRCHAQGFCFNCHSEGRWTR